MIGSTVAKPVSLEGVPAINWGKKNKSTIREEYLKIAKEINASQKYQSAGFHVHKYRVPTPWATRDGVNYTVVLK